MLGIHREACFPQVRGKGQNRLPDARADACSLQLVSGKGNGGACGWVPRVGSRVLSPPPDGLADIGLGSDSVCARPSSHRIKSFDSLGPQPAHGRTSQLFQGQYRSLDMSDNSNNQLVIRANFNFQQKNEDKLSFTKGDIIHIT